MPRDSSRKIIVGVNDLATTHPQLASEAVGWDPKVHSKGMGRIVRWKCSKGHEWTAKVSSRVNGSGCQVCNRRQQDGITNCLAIEYPEIAAQADGWDPSRITSASTKKMDWKCSVGHRFVATVRKRTTESFDCPICRDRELLSGFNDLKTKFPEIAAEADGWDPSQVKFNVQKYFNWKCSEGHQWRALLQQRLRLQTNCPYCAGLLTISGKNDLQTTHPEIAAEADGWDPTTIKAGSSKNLWWKCRNGDRFKTTPNLRTRKDNPRGCPICSGRRLAAGRNDLATTHPLLAAQADGWDPKTVSRGMVKKLAWKCEKGHRWVASPNDASSNKFLCPQCEQERWIYFGKSLSEAMPELASEADGWDPKEIGVGSKKKLGWKCRKGHRWIATTTNRVQHKSGCPVCANQKVWPGENDLLTLHPNLASEADGWDPRLVLAGGRKKLPWRCENGHVWTTSVKDRIKGRGCPTCADYGYDPNNEAILYFLRHERLAMFQIGITNSPDTRLSKHKSSGWEVIEVWGPADGHLVRDWERDIKSFLKKNGAVMGPRSGVPKFDGYTESWLELSFPVKSINQLMDLVRDSESKEN